MWLSGIVEAHRFRSTKSTYVGLS